MYEVELDNSYYILQKTIIEWCWEQFGSGSWGSTLSHDCEWGYDSIFGNTTFFFKNEKDLLWFNLAWL